MQGSLSTVVMPQLSQSLDTLVLNVVAVESLSEYVDDPIENPNYASHASKLRHSPPAAVSAALEELVKHRRSAAKAETNGWAHVRQAAQRVQKVHNLPLHTARKARGTPAMACRRLLGYSSTEQCSFGPGAPPRAH